MSERVIVREKERERARERMSKQVLNQYTRKWLFSNDNYEIISLLLVTPIFESIYCRCFKNSPYHFK